MRNFKIVAALKQVAEEAGHSMAQVALNWLHQRAGVASILVGATRKEQLEDSLAALDFTLAPELVARLDEISQPAKPFPYYMFADDHQPRIHGQVAVSSKPGSYWHAARIPAASSTTD